MNVTTICRNVSLLLITGLVCAAASCKSHSNVKAPTSNKQPAGDFVAQADQLYAQREDLMRVRQGIVLLRQARTGDFKSYEAAWRLAKFNYYLGTHTNSNDERNMAFREGIDSGRAAVKLEDGKPDGHFWLGANYCGIAQTGALAGLATVDDIRNEMATVIRLDEGYQNGSAYMMLGLVYLQDPSIHSGNFQKAIDEMEKGLRIGKTNALLHLHLAEAYLLEGRKADARRELDAIISMTPDQNFLPEYKEAVSEARQMLGQTR